jgi:putative addiction module component (TIGR02574 family)
MRDVSHHESTAGARAYTGHMSTLDIAKLSPEERLELLEQLWDSLSPEAIPMTDAQTEELDRRLDELDRDGPVGIPWNEVLERIRNRAL